MEDKTMESGNSSNSSAPKNKDMDNKTMGAETKNDAMTSKPEQNSGIATAALTLGILSLFFWLIPLLGFIVSIVGLVLGIKTRTAKRGKWGMILSIIGLIFSIGFFIVSAALTAITINAL